MGESLRRPRRPRRTNGNPAPFSPTRQLALYRVECQAGSSTRLGRVQGGRVGHDGRMRSVEEHRALVSPLLAPMSTEDVDLARARGRVLAADVTAKVARP